MKTLVILVCSVVIFISSNAYSDSSPYSKGVDIVNELKAQGDCEELWAMRSLFVSGLFELITYGNITVETLLVLPDRQFRFTTNNSYTSCIDIIADVNSRFKKKDKSALDDIRNIAVMFDEAYKECTVKRNKENN